MRSRDDALSVTVKVFLILVMAFMFAMALYGCGPKQACTEIYEGQVASNGYTFKFEDRCGHKVGDVIAVNAGSYGTRLTKIIKVGGTRFL